MCWVVSAVLIFFNLNLTVQPLSHWHCAVRVFEQPVKPESVRQLLAERDRTIIQLMKVSGWGAARVLGLGYDEWRLVLSLGNALNWRETRAYLLRYIRVIRPALAGGRACQALFVGTAGRDGIGVDALSYRVKILLLS